MKIKPKNFISIIKYIIIPLLIFPSFVFSQNTEKEIDSLLIYEVYNLRNNAMYEEIILLCDDIITSSHKLGYISGEAWAYTHKANALCTIGKHKESKENLISATKLASSLNDNSLNSYIAIETGRNYTESNTSNNQAIIAYKDAVKYAHRIKDEYDRETFLLYAYENLYSAYWNIDQYDKAISYLWKTLSIEESAYSLYGLTHYHIYNTKNEDSIVYYLNRSANYLEERPDAIFEKALLFNQWGGYLEDKGLYDEAIENYFEAEVLTKEIYAGSEYLNALSNISKAYEALGDIENSYTYSKKYIQAQDSINSLYKKNVNHVVDSLIENKNTLSQKIYSLIFVFVIGFLGLTIFLFFAVRLIKKRKQKLIIKNKKLLLKKDEENKILSKKINEAYDEIICMAKDNHPEFYTRFQEIYPEFNSALLDKNKRLTISELTLAAYVYLGFTSKEIAEFTFRSPKTIEATRYNLRKKLNLSSKVNLQSWLIELSSHL